MTTNAQPNRQPKGVPTGGQFAASARPEVNVDLTGSMLSVGTSWHTDAPLERYTLNAMNRRCDELIHNIEDGYLTLDAPYQRGSVWTQDQKIGLVNSLIRGVPVPAVIINHRASAGWGANHGVPGTGEPHAAVIDGKQRVETVRDWFTGRLAVPATWFPADRIATTRKAADGAEWVTYDDLTRPGQMWTKNRFSFPTAEAQVDSISEEAGLYLLVNGAGTAQTDDDMANAASVARGD